MAKLALGPALVELGICKMAEIAGGFRYFKMLRVRFVLVAGGAIDFLTLDLVFFKEMGLVNKIDLIGELDLFGHELVFRFSVAGGGRTAGIEDHGSRPDRFTPQFQVGNMAWCPNGNVNFGRACLSPLGRILPLGGLRGIMAINTVDIIVFSLFPSLMAFIKNGGIRQNMAVAAEPLRLLDGRVRKISSWHPLLFSPREVRKEDEYHGCGQNRKDAIDSLSTHTLSPLDGSHLTKDFYEQSIRDMSRFLLVSTKKLGILIKKEAEFKVEKSHFLLP